MSAANFCTMRDFPLFAKDYYRRAPGDRGRIAGLQSWPAVP